MLSVILEFMYGVYYCIETARRIVVIKINLFSLVTVGSFLRDLMLSWVLQVVEKQGMCILRVPKSL